MLAKHIFQSQKVAKERKLFDCFNRADIENNTRITGARFLFDDEEAGSVSTARSTVILSPLPANHHLQRYSLLRRS
jgi:hypothetical protein